VAGSQRATRRKMLTEVNSTAASSGAFLRSVLFYRLSKNSVFCLVWERRKLPFYVLEKLRKFNLRVIGGYRKHRLAATERRLLLRNDALVRLRVEAFCEGSFEDATGLLASCFVRRCLTPESRARARRQRLADCQPFICDR
jgi:hypothetical protein